MQLAKDLAKKAMSEGAGKNGVQIERRRSRLRITTRCRKRCRLGSAKRKRATMSPCRLISIRPRKHTAELLAICAALHERLGVAVTLGFGPRFLHSTGQLHKGGPNSALVLQIVDQPADNLAVPETNYTFDTLIKAQALGDFTALKQRRRRALRVDLGERYGRWIETISGQRARTV